MVKIIEEPQLRYTKQLDGEQNIAVTNVLVEFEDIRPQEPAMNLKLVAWGNIALEINSKYHQGDRAIVQGRLAMNTISRNGIKEKKAELIVSKIYLLPKMKLEDLDRSVPSSASNQDLVSISKDLVENNDARSSEFEDNNSSNNTFKASSIPVGKEKPRNLERNENVIPTAEQMDNLPF